MVTNGWQDACLTAERVRFRCLPVAIPRSRVAERPPTVGPCMVRLLPIPSDRPKAYFMRKTLPSTMFSDPERSRLSMLRAWVLDHAVTEIEMNERQFWNFAQLQPPAERPWVTFMGRIICVPDMPAAVQKNLGIVDKHNTVGI